MDKLSEQDLLKAYFDAVKIGCDIEFIQMLQDEIRRRGMKIPPKEAVYSLH